MKSLIAAIFIIAGLGGAAQAATIINTDGQDYSLQITEGGAQSEVGIAAGQSVSVCPAGCFVTMPNGDRETLSGGETVEIVNGKANIK
jgi:opacity protein-like surface antigen